MKQVVHQGDALCSEKQLTQTLVQLGYELEEIEAALKLIYAITDSFKTRTGTKTILAEINEGYRVFSPTEQDRFTMAFRGEILRLTSTNLLSNEEIEEILFEAYLMDKKEVGLRELDQLLNKVIKDEERLLIIAPYLVVDTPSFLLN
jgi:uncharacterized protein Smg (DUF494 family)